MPKNLPAQEGYRLYDVLDSIWPCDDLNCGRVFHFPPSSGSKKPDKPMSYPFGDVRKGVNDICCTDAQAHLLLERMNAAAGRMNGPEVTGIIAMANSFRVDCQNCLNAKCTHRDPAFPVEEVRARTLEGESK